MLVRIARSARLYGKLQFLHLRAHLEYEADFWIGMLGAGLRTTSTFVFIWALFGRINQVQGWGMWEIASLYALAIIPMGLVELFYDGQWELRRLVNLGEFDRLLLRPLSPALQVVTQISSIHGLGTVLLGAVVLAAAASKLGLEWTPGHYLFLAASLAGSVLLIGSLNFITNCQVFWEPTPNAALSVLVQESVEFAKYPLGLYHSVVRFIVTWILPLAFVSYYPGLVLLGRPDPKIWLGYAAPLAGPLLTAVAALVWRACLRNYQGTGS
jgi:ABC-2 type transport system permease protein